MKMKKMKRIYRKPFMKPVELKDCGALCAGTTGVDGPGSMVGGNNDPTFDEEEES